MLIRVIASDIISNSSVNIRGSVESLNTAKETFFDIVDDGGVQWVELVARRHFLMLEVLLLTEMLPAKVEVLPEVVLEVIQEEVQQLVQVVTVSSP